VKDRLHSLAAQQLGVDPDAAPRVEVAPPAPEAEPEPPPSPPAADVPVAPPPRAPAPRTMPHIAALGGSEIVMTDDAGAAARPAAGPAIEEDGPVRVITDFGAVLFLVVVLLLAGVMMYAINHSRF